MSWTFFSLLSAFFQATTDAFSKKVLRENCDVYLVGWDRWFFAVSFLLTMLLFIYIPTLDQTFWLNVFLLLPLKIIALILYIKALKLSPSLIEYSLSFFHTCVPYTHLLSHVRGTTRYLRPLRHFFCYIRWLSPQLPHHLSRNA